MEIQVAPDAPVAAAVAAAWIVRRARDAVRRRGRFVIAVSGGSTPAAMFAELAVAPAMPWEHTTVFQVDERIAPDGAPERNLTGLATHLGAAASAADLRPMPVNAADLDTGAAQYADQLARRPIDVVHLGVGDDGHTASWPPGDPVGRLRGQAAPAVVTTAAFNGLRRMTLTPPVVNAARRRLVLVTGAAKASVVERWMLRDRALPIDAVRRSGTTLVLDSPAAVRLPGGEPDQRRRQH